MIIFMSFKKDYIHLDRFFFLSSRLLVFHWDARVLMKCCLEGKAKSLKCSAQNPCCPLRTFIHWLQPMPRRYQSFLLIFHLVGERHKDNLHSNFKCCSIFSEGSITWKNSQSYCIYYISSRSSGMNSSVRKWIWNLDWATWCCNHQNIDIPWSIWK